MALVETLRRLGRVVAYYPELTDLTGSATATLLLCQLIYWTGKQADPAGWIYKTQADWWEELRLTRSEQETARKRLREAGFIEEQRRGIPARLYFRLRVAAINEAWSALQTRMRDSSTQAGDDAADQDAATPQTSTETTTEKTHQTKPDLALRLLAAERPLAVPPRPRR